ncbi:MAG: hypothetical protein M3N52_10940 [Actinomycetota bacterium]|nr:hypothetical protein [Actinomycetota bacterium]
MRIDCDECLMQHTEACQDCIVTFLLDRPAGAVVLDVDEEHAVRTLQAAGLTPGSRFLPREHSPSAPGG